jgi:hypothetical protein
VRCVYGWRSFADVDILVFRLATATEGRRIQLGDLPHSPATEFPKHGGSMNSGVCVSNLAPTSKFVCVCYGIRTVCMVGARFILVREREMCSWAISILFW